MVKKKVQKKKWMPEHLDVVNQQGKVVGKSDLDADIFDGYINNDLMHQAIVTHLANLRQGTVATKTRGMVRGGGKKPWRQKGTGRARFGSIRTPIWVGGGVTFGPRTRDFNKKFPKKMKRLAFKSALNSKLKSSQIIILEDLKLKGVKTKEFADILKKLKIKDARSLFVKKEVKDDVVLSSRNIPNVSIRRANDVSTYTILNCKHLVITKDSLDVLKKRVTKG